MTLKELSEVANYIDFHDIAGWYVETVLATRFGGSYPEEEYDRMYNEVFGTLATNRALAPAVLRLVGDWTVDSVRPCDDEIVVRLRVPQPRIEVTQC